MRKKLALSALGAAVALTVAPAQQASAVCSEPYYQLTGKCSPCNHLGIVVRVVHHVAGEELVTVHCLA